MWRRFAVCESVLPPALMADERFREALETAYDRLGAPHAALTRGVILMSTSRRTFIAAAATVARPPMPEHPPP